MEPSELAQLVFERVVDYCQNHSGDTPLDCMLSHNPDEFSTFTESYLDDEELEELQNVEDPKAFDDEAEKEYAKLWSEWLSEEIAYRLGHSEIEDLAYNIANSDKLDNASKVERLKAYAKVLREFADTIKLALQEKKPLSSTNLYNWFKRLAEVTSSFNANYRKEVQYYLDFYDLFDVDQLLTLDLLSQYVNRTLRKIENKYLPELEALTNES
jgi:uncharacterized protein YeaO (DUF488 family)